MFCYTLTLKVIHIHTIESHNICIFDRYNKWFDIIIKDSSHKSIYIYNTCISTVTSIMIRKVCFFKLGRFDYHIYIEKKFGPFWLSCLKGKNLGRFIYHNYVVKKLGRFGNRFGPFWSGPFRIWAVLTIHRLGDPCYKTFLSFKWKYARSIIFKSYYLYRKTLISQDKV